MTDHSPSGGSLARYRVIGTPNEAAFDDLTRFAAALCGTSVALVGFVDAGRIWFKARHGTDIEQIGATNAPCVAAMQDDDVMVVPDMVQDPRFAAGECVGLGLRFYAGAALRSPEGEAIGTLCVLDPAPRPEGLTALQQQGLAVLARQVMTELALRREMIERHEADEAAAQALSASIQRFAVLADTMPQMVWSTTPDGLHDYYNARWYEFTGVAPGSTDGEGWNGMFHADDQPRAWALWSHSLATGEPYEIEYRLRHHSGAYRWTLGRALPTRDADGRITRWFGTCTDIDQQKRTMEEHEVITHELSHRIKNIFSVISGLIGVSARTRPEMREGAADLRERVFALGRAHDFVRPHSADSRTQHHTSSLRGLIAELMLPYQSGDGSRIIVEGEDAGIDDRSATPIALIFHELATNAAKYGALSGHGQVRLSIDQVADGWRMIWAEAGGPVIAAPERTGFGTRLIDLSLCRQLGGSLNREWRPEGLQVELIVPFEAMSRSGAEH